LGNKIILQVRISENTQTKILILIMENMKKAFRENPEGLIEHKVGGLLII